MRRRPGALAAQPSIISSPWRSCIAAAGIAGFLALVGRSRPGTFLKSTAVVSIFDLSLAASGIYGRREMNRGVFKLDEIEPKPGKLWESSKQWTVEDATLSGGALGIFTALNPRAFPGVSGWKRFLGVATVGCAVGYQAGQRVLVRIPSQLLALIDSADALTQQTQYDRLQQNAEAKASLSRFGKLALSVYTWPALQLLRGPSAFGAGPAMGGAQHGPHPGHSGHGAPGALQTLQDTITFNVEFEKEELDGPDIEDGSRSYRDSLKTRDVAALEDYLEHLEKLKQTITTEGRYVWQELAKKERLFYDMIDEDDEKDLFRREIQLLNSVATQFISRDAILTFHIADVRKQLSQVEHNSSSSSAVPSLSSPLESEIFIRDESQHSPQLTTNQVRIVWMRQKEVLAHLEQVVAQYDAIESHNGGTANPNVDLLRQNLGYMTKNVEATGRLLKELEEQVRRADEKGKT